MKKQILFGLLFITGISVKAQVWSPTGATWTYSYTNNFSIVGYVEIKYTNDSLVGGKMCKVLEKKRYSFDYGTSKYDTLNLGLEFTYLDSNKVYYYRFNQFFTLYDFNAQPSDWWTMAGWNDPGGCDSTGKIQVDSTSVMIINSDTLKYLKVSMKDTSDWYLGTKIIERIGSDEYMFPEPWLCNIDANEGGFFRCYWDDSFPTYNSGIVTSCDYITAIEEKKSSNKKLLVYPNPTSGKITIGTRLPTDKDDRIKIFNLFGELLYEEKLVVQQIDISNLPTGVYLLQVEIGGKVMRKKIVKL